MIWGKNKLGEWGEVSFEKSALRGVSLHTEALAPAGERRQGQLASRADARQVEVKKGGPLQLKV